MGFVILNLGIEIEEKGIKAIKSWPEPKLVTKIQVFLSFTNFYKRCIKNFNRIIALLILILQITIKITDNKILSIQANKSKKN